MDAIIIAIIGSGALSALISGIFGLIKDKGKKKGGVAEGVQLLLYDRIKYLGKHHIANGQIDSDDLEDIVRMWECYHNDLNGNGYLDGIMSQVKALPIITHK